MKNRICILLLSLLLAVPVLPYSALWLGGLGEPLPQMTARTMAMGGVSIAIPYHVTGINPASISLDKTCISLTGVQEVVSTTGGDIDGSVNSSDFKLPEISIGFPLSWEATVDAKYVQTIDADCEFSRQDTIDGNPYIHELSRDGLVATASVGLSKKFHPVTIGVRGLMNFGSFLDEQQIDFESGNYEDASDQFTREFRGFGYEFGVLCRLAPVLVGGFYRTKSDVGSDLVLPSAYGVGVSYSSDRTLIGLDYTVSCWNQTHENYDDARAIGIGGEYSLGQPKLRAGYRYSSSYYREIKEHMLTAGVGFPLAKGRAGLELAMELGIRSGSNEDDPKEKFGRLGFTFWGSEKWERRTSYP